MANLYPALFVLFFMEKVFSAGKISLKCTPEFCDEYVQKNPCPPLDPACSNPNISLVIPSPTPCNCCEHCFIFKDLGEDCVTGGLAKPIPNVMCKEGTSCCKGTCLKMRGFDWDFYRGYECEDGRCYCSVIENNERKTIFGTFNETKDMIEEKQCACSMTAYLATKAVNNVFSIPNTYVPTPRCLPNGQFDPLQCIDNLCGCVNRTTGTWDSTVRKVFLWTLGPNNPKCFDPTRHRIGQYYKTCEKERNNLMADVSFADSGEIGLLLSHTVECTPDGEYAKPSLI